MSPKKEGAPAAQKKQGQSRLVGINARFIKFREFARSIHAMIAAGIPGAPDEIKEKIAAAAARADQAVAACNETAEALLVLNKLKWAPPRGRETFGPGSLAMVKPRHVDKHAAFFDKADLAHLRIVEVKGKSARVEIFRDNLAGEKFIVPVWQLQGREAAASK